MDLSLDKPTRSKPFFWNQDYGTKKYGHSILDPCRAINNSRPPVPHPRWRLSRRIVGIPIKQGIYNHIGTASYIWLYSSSVSWWYWYNFISDITTSRNLMEVRPQAENIFPSASAAWLNIRATCRWLNAGLLGWRHCERWAPMICTCGTVGC